MSKRAKTGWILFGTLLLVCTAMAAVAYYYLLAPQFQPDKKVYVYIDRDDNLDSVLTKVRHTGQARQIRGMYWLAQYRDYARQIRTGRYAIQPGENVYHVFSRLYRGYQEPLNITIGNPRTIDRIARSAGNRLMLDSAEVANLLADSAFVHSLGYTAPTLPCLFVPDTYEVYWDITAHDFLLRMQKEHKRFWNEERLGKAQAAGLTPHEVCTLASIVEEETNNAAEQPMVAGLYLNRLRRGMLLQADPTVKFAVGDFGLRRITHAHLKTASPYNTYLHAGLPPGPIRVASPQGIDAVLNYARHSYLYMCAKEDFSGTHNFATTLAEHARNARRYQQALNRRKIFK